MLDIKEHLELNIDNLLSYRGTFKQSELPQIGQAMEAEVRRLGAACAGKAITATYGVQGDTIDVEIYIPLDHEVTSSGKYVFKKELKIVNAVVASYKGHPSGLQDACIQLNNYITSNGLMPITVGFNVTKNADPLAPENTEIDIYVGISPNIL